MSTLCISYVLIFRLLQDPRVLPNVHNNGPLRKAVSCGYADIVCELLSHPSVDPAIGNSEPLRIASEKGFLDVVKVVSCFPNCIG